jgi:hypothetical protein
VNDYKTLDGSLNTRIYCRIQDWMDRAQNVRDANGYGDKLWDKLSGFSSSKIVFSPPYHPDQL